MSIVKEKLKNLCCNNGWSYGVFWRFDQRNSSFLTLEEAFYEEQMGALIDDMLLQVHILGGGVIGQVAFTKKHKWMLADSHFGIQSAAGSLESSDTFQDQSQLDHQFSIGIKTIAVIYVEPIGVVQFGSTQKIPESLEFVSRTKELFRGIEIVQGLIFPESEQSSWNGYTYDRNELLISKNTYCGSYNLQHSDSFDDFIKTSFSAENIDQSFSITASSFGENCFRMADTESQFYSDGGISDIPSTFFDFSSSQGPGNSSWSFGDVQECSKLNSDSSYGLFSDTITTSQNRSLLDSGAVQIQSPTILDTFAELFEENDSAKSLSKDYAMEDVFQWFDPMVATDSSGVVSLSSSPKGYLAPKKIISDNQPSTSGQSSITNPFDFAAMEKSSDIFGVHKQLECPGVDLRSQNSRDDLNFMASSSEGVSELYADCRTGTKSTLFSTLGLYHHFGGVAGSSISVARSHFDDHSSSTAKRRKIESSFLSSNQMKCLPGFARNIDPGPSESRSEVTRTLGARSYLGDSSRFVDEQAISEPKKHEQTAKMKKKRAKPGTKQKSKDRVQTAARLADLRELIPNGDKMSIDKLLHRTIKHLLYLESVTRHAEKLEQTDEAKNGMVQKEKASSSNGVTWACEVGKETMFCPLIVEDLSIRGQILIEILCEDQGFFLEIVDIIRGFGLTILKGVMEVRETKLWARFTVEAEEQRQITRHEIFSSLIQLLQLTGPTEVQKSSELANTTMDGGAGLFNNSHQSCVPLPVSLDNNFFDTHSR